MLSLLQPQELGNPNMLGEHMTLLIETASPVSEATEAAFDFAVASGELHAVQPADVVTVEGRQYRRHANGGGLVEVTAFAAPTVFVGPNARVEDHAIVLGEVEVRDTALVGGYALVADRCVISKKSCVGGDAVLRKRVWMRHSARADGSAVLLGSVTVEYTRHINAGTFLGTLTIS